MDGVQWAVLADREGFVVDQTFSGQIEQNIDFFDDITSTRAVYLEPDGSAYDVGDVFRNRNSVPTWLRSSARYSAEIRRCGRA